jgi:hypothetical protein
MGPGFSQPLAIDGGPRAKASPFPPRRRHGEREKQLLGEVVDSDILFFWLGTKVLELQRRVAGTYGDIATFSFNHFKHIECGSGGLVVTDDDRLRYRASLFLDKCYQREEGIRNPSFLAPNYQMTELQGAVALAQIEKVEAIGKVAWHMARRAAAGVSAGARR